MSSAITLKTKECFIISGKNVCNLNICTHLLTTDQLTYGLLGGGEGGSRGNIIRYKL